MATENSNPTEIERLKTKIEALKKEVETKDIYLKEIGATLDAIYNASSESIWVCDGTGTVLSVNKATEELLGVPVSEIVGMNTDTLVREGLMDKSVTNQVLKSRQKTSIIQEIPRIGKQLLVTGTPVFEEDGQLSMVIVNERDLTQLNRLKEELEEAKEESSRYKEELTHLNLKELENQDIIAQSKEMQDVLITCQKLATIDISNILILGESGTGKGLFAKYIHTNNQRLTGPFVKINCAAVPENLLEAELFGYEKGSFTGAGEKGKIGLFEMAQDGTIFLDEIGELPLSLQAKLLHCLEEKEIMHIGGLQPIEINCNVITATNIDLSERASKDYFRKDLYYRLNTFPITLPPLRNRPEDILGLALFFLDKFNKEFGLSRKISITEIKKLQSHSFPGNVRELKNSLKRSMVMAEQDSLRSIVDYEAVAIDPKKQPASSNTANYYADQAERVGFNQIISSFEKQLLTEALSNFKTSRSLASHLKMTPSQAYRKLVKHQLTHLLKSRKDD
jgi:PAS domain S-box-containing protein